MSRKKPAWRFPVDTVDVCMDRNGMSVRATVPAGEMWNVLRYFTAGFRALAKDVPESVPAPDIVPGAGPLPVWDDDYADEGRKRVGF